MRVSVDDDVGRLTLDQLLRRGAAQLVSVADVDPHPTDRPLDRVRQSGVSRAVGVAIHGDDGRDELELIAPVLAVYGNTDGPGNSRLSESIERTIGGVRVHVSHGHELGSPTPEKLLERYAADVIVYGHTHKQLVVRADGRLVVNPGAAGARRFKLEPSVARLMIAHGGVEVELVPLGE